MPDLPRWRVLPFDEWYRVAEIEPYKSGGLPNSDYWRIVVVERAGVIVACCSLFDTVHWDNFWVADEARGNPVVFRELVEGGVTVMDDFDIALVHTTVPHERGDVAAMLERFGFSKAHGDLYFYQRRKDQE